MEAQLSLVPALNKVDEATGHVIQSYNQPMDALDTKEGRALATLRGKTANLALLLPTCVLPMSCHVVEQLESLMDCYENLDYEQFNSHISIIAADVESAAQHAEQMTQLCAKYERDAAALGGELQQAIKAAMNGSNTSGSQAAGNLLAAFFFGAVALVTGVGVVGAVAGLAGGAIAGGEVVAATVMLGGGSVASGLKSGDHGKACASASDCQTRLSRSAAVASGSVAPAAALLSGIATQLVDFFTIQQQDLKRRATYVSSASSSELRMRLEHDRFKTQAGRIKRECAAFLKLAGDMKSSFTRLETKVLHAGDYDSAYLANWKAESRPCLQKLTSLP